MQRTLLPVQVILDAACSPAVRRVVHRVAATLSPSINELSMAGGPDNGNWVDAPTYKTIVAAAVLLGQPASFLEIGVRKGHGLATAAMVNPAISLLGFDLWPENGTYAGEANPGPEFVRRELRAAGHMGELTLIRGSSLESVPRYAAKFPRPTHQLISVDGSHVPGDAAADLRNVLPLLAPCGILLFDDISHPGCPGLLKVWREFSEGYERAEMTHHAYGVGIMRRTK